MESSDEEEDAHGGTPLPFLFSKSKPKPPILIELSKGDLSDDLFELWLYPDSGKLEYRVVTPLPPTVPPPRPPRGRRYALPPQPEPPLGPPPQLSRHKPPSGSPPSRKKICE